VTDLKLLKERVTIGEVLAFYGASIGSSRGSYDAWVPISCPFCKDSSGSASVQRAAGRFLCHQCGAPRDGKSGDIFDVVRYAERLQTNKDAIEWIDRNFG
jgi:hypothetical protein